MPTKHEELEQANSYYNFAHQKDGAKQTKAEIQKIKKLLKGKLKDGNDNALLLLGGG